MTLNESGSGNVLFTTKNNSNAFEDIWDDSELIKLYEKSTAQTYEKIQGIVDCNGGFSTPQKQEKKKWKVGDICMAPYDKDGLWYKAKIESLSKSTCKINFIEYDTKATVKLEQLMNEDELEWVGETEDMEQEETQVATTTSEEQQDNKNKATDIKPTLTTSNRDTAIGNVFSIPELCPPPPPMLFDKAMIVASSEKEALTNALMGWYMAGYHTGFYQGLKHQKTSKE